MEAAAIKDAISRLERADRKHTVFGASAHKWQLLPPASATAIRQFETRHKIVLPADYRNFLLEVGNGGAGPHYGLFPLGVFSEGRAVTDLVGTFARPFPHRKAWDRDDRDDRPDPEENEAAYFKWRDAYFDSKWIDGAIPICHEGCGYYDLLVVTGAERGHIWIDGRVSDQGIAPSGKRKRLTFLDWYCDWLAECLRKRRLR